jgi:ribonuclease R
MGRKRKGTPPENTSVTKRAAKQIEPLIVEFLNQTPGRGYQVKQILKGLGVRDAKSKGVVSEVIFGL